MSVSFKKEFLKVLEARSRIEQYVHKTPVLTSTAINKIAGCSIYFKPENFQKVGAFKARGAFNALMSLSEQDKMKGVVTHSSGNHAQALSLAAHTLNIKATIVMPENAPIVKRKATIGYGSNVETSGNTPALREAKCKEVQDREGGSILIHPYDNINVIRGAGTVALELIEQTEEDLDCIFCPIGGGGLMSGTIISSKGNKWRKVPKVYGCEPKICDDAKRSLDAGRIILNKRNDTIADGLRTNLSKLTFDFISNGVDDIFTVSEDEILNAMRLIWERMKIVIEPSSAVGLATILKYPELVKGKKCGVIITGGNVDLSTFFEYLKTISAKL